MYEPQKRKYQRKIYSKRRKDKVKKRKGYFQKSPKNTQIGDGLNFLGEKKTENKNPASKGFQSIVMEI